MARGTTKKKIGVRYDAWEAKHASALNVLENKVGWVSTATTVIGLAIGVFAPELSIAVKGIEIGLKVSTLMNLTADVTGVVSGVSQIAVGSAMGAGHGEVFNILGGVANTALSMTDIRATELLRESDVATKTLDISISKANELGVTIERDQAEVERLAERVTVDSEKALKAKALYESAQQFSDVSNIVLATVGGVGMGIDELATQSYTTGSLMTGYGIAYIGLSYLGR